MVYVPDRDEDGHPQYKNVIALDGYHYEPRALDFKVATYQSLYNRKDDNGTVSAGTDYGDAEMKFYDSSDAELSYQQSGYESEIAVQFQARLTAGCTKTVVWFTPNFKYCIKSGVVMLREEVTTDCYLWCTLAPHIPEASGGNVPFLAGGYNLSFFPSKSFIRMDGNTTFVIENDLVYYTNRIGLIVKHYAGDDFGVQMIYELYKE
jgi:hypothetical protein